MSELIGNAFGQLPGELVGELFGESAEYVLDKRALRCGREPTSRHTPGAGAGDCGAAGRCLIETEQNRGRSGNDRANAFRSFRPSSVPRSNTCVTRIALSS